MRIHFRARLRTDSALPRNTSLSVVRPGPCHVAATATDSISSAFFLLMPGSLHSASLFRPTASPAPCISPHASAKSPSHARWPPPPGLFPDSQHGRALPPQASAGPAAHFRTHVNLADQSAVLARRVSPRKTFLLHTSPFPASAPSTFRTVLPFASRTRVTRCQLPGPPIRTPSPSPPSAPAAPASR